MKIPKFFLFLTISLVFSLSLAGCYGGEKTNLHDTSRAIRVLESAEIPGMDSVLGQDQLTFTMLNNTNEGLYRLDEKQEPVPGVADGMPIISEDKLVYTIKIKQDLKWSNGESVTAHDFVFAYQRALDPEVASPYGPYMMIGKIKNADKVYKQSVKPEELGVVAKDDNTLEITLAKPLDYFTSLLTFQTFYPQNEKYVAEQGGDYAKDSDHLIFNGPYKLVEWSGPTDTKWRFVKNKDYWNAEKVASIENIKFNVSKDGQASANVFDAGEADITPRLAQAAIISQYEASPNLLRYLEPSICWLKMNQENEVFKNRNIRRAVTLAIDKQALVDDVLQNGSIAAYFIVPKEFVADENGKDFREGVDYLPTNKKVAATLWKQGLAEIGESELTVTMVDQDTDSAKTTAAFIKDQLESTLEGLTVNVESLPFKIRLDREDKQKYDLLVGGWGPDYSDPMTYLDLWLTDGAQNKMSYSNTNYDALIKKADVDLATKPAERWKTLQEAEKQLLEGDAALAPLYQRTVNILVNERVKNLVHHNLGGEFSYFLAKLSE